jgi:hypothetical protein
MSKPEQLRKHALECLRLEADCLQLAGDARHPNAQSHFVRMARHWFDMAVAGPNADTGRQIADGRTETT